MNSTRSYPAAALLALLLATPALARLPEPDAIVWGSITLDGVRLTAARSDVVVQARATANGPVLASYRMGSEPAAGDRYLLRIPLETVDLPVSPLAVPVGAALRIQVVSAVQTFGDQVQTVAERGQIRRLDFTIGGGGDNGLPDSWEIRFFGAAGQNPTADPDSDGRSNREEFEAGTDPTRPDAGPQVEVGLADTGPVILFLAERATGGGYEGYSRFYTLESTGSLGLGATWTPVPGLADLAGNGQEVTHAPPLATDVRFYRLRLVTRQP